MCPLKIKSLQPPPARFSQLEDRKIIYDAARGLASLSRLIEPQELQLTRRLSNYPEIVQQCALQRAPHTLVHYLRDVAHDFHSYYSAHQFIVEDAALRDARLTLAFAAQVVIGNALALLGVSAPETM